MTLWSYSVGAKGGTVRVYERTPGGPLSLAVWDPTLRNGRGGLDRRALRHRDKGLAAKEARRVASALEAGQAHSHNPGLGSLIELYQAHQVAGMEPGSRKWVTQNLGIWKRFLGGDFALKSIGPREWDRFKVLRLSGAIDGQGQPVDLGDRRPVGPGTVNLGLEALTMLCNWAVVWRVREKPLLDRSPVWRLPFLKNPNVRRPIWTHDQYLLILDAAESQRIQVTRGGKRRRERSPLADVLFLCEATGRRQGAVRRLRAEDLRLAEGLYGKVQWPALTDKQKTAWLTPINPEVRERLLRIVGTRGLGPGYLFPSATRPDEPIGEDVLRLQLHRLCDGLKIPRIRGLAFHGLRRKWVTERKHLADADVAAAGGWKSIQTMKQAYQLADEAGVLEAVLEPRRLRDRA